MSPLSKLLAQLRDLQVSRFQRVNEVEYRNCKLSCRLRIIFNLRHAHHAVGITCYRADCTLCSVTDRAHIRSSDLYPTPGSYPGVTKPTEVTE